MTAEPPASLLSLHLAAPAPRPGSGVAANDAPDAPEGPGAREEPGAARVSAQPSTSPVPEAETAPVPSDLYAYWRRLARGGSVDGGLADGDKLDASLIGTRWPFSLLLRGAPEAPLDIVRVFRPDPDAPGGSAAASRGGHPLAEDMCSQVSSWALAMARQALLTRKPEVAVERFVLADAERMYRALALPCRRAGSPVPDVLLYLHLYERSGAG
jgi:hypothetical protein